MIQRAQTIHLLIVLGLMIAMLFPNFATVSLDIPPGALKEQVAPDGTITRTTVTTGMDSEIVFNAKGIFQKQTKIIPVTYLLVLLIVAIGMSFITIFLYRKRWLQIRLCFALAVVLIGIAAFIVMYIYKLKEGLDVLTSHPYVIGYSIVDVFPLVALFFVYFAYRGIIKDEALVKSLDRIR